MRKFVCTLDRGKIFADGDLGAYADARKAYMKQKHRMVWEKRNGHLSEQTKWISKAIKC